MPSSLPILYLHGFASGPSSSKAQFFVQRFGELGIPIEVPELDGGDFEGLTITGQLEIIRRIADGRPVRLIGSSLGGYLAALYAATHPETQRVVMLAPAFGFARHWANELGEERVNQWKADGAMPYYHYGSGEERLLGYQLLEDAARYPENPDVRQPALILHGSQDVVVPPSLSIDFAGARPNVRLEILESDHQLTGVLEILWDRVSRFFGVESR